MRVYLATPTGGRVIDETVMCLIGIATSTKLHRVSLFKDTYCCRNHNEIVQHALDTQADAVMMVDSDQEVPDNVVDVLASHRKDIVGCAYRRRQPPFDLMPPGEPTTGLKEVEWLPSGCMMVRMGVFQKIPYPWFPNLYGKSTKDFVGSDRVFSRKAKAAGYSMWCDYDLSRRVTHIAEVALAYDGALLQPGTIGMRQ